MTNEKYIATQKAYEQSICDSAKCCCSPYAWNPELAKAMCPIHGKEQTK